MNRVALIGSGGFAAELEDMAAQLGWNIVGCYALSGGRFPSLYRGYKDELLRDRRDYDAVLLGIGAVSRETLEVRRNFLAWLSEYDLPCPPLISPAAIRARGVVVGRGSVIGPGAILGLNAKLGEFCVVNSGAILGHDVALGENVTVAPGAFVAGGCSISDGSLIGPLAKILQNVSVGSASLIGMGANVFRDVPDGSDVWPRPDRAIKPS